MRETSQHSFETDNADLSSPYKSSSLARDVESQGEGIEKGFQNGVFAKQSQK